MIGLPDWRESARHPQKRQTLRAKVTQMLIAARAFPFKRITIRDNKIHYVTGIQNMSIARMGAM